MARITIETTDKTVTVNGWTQAKGNFTVQNLGDGYAQIGTHTGQGLRAKLEDITINGVTPVSYEDLVVKAQDFFKESGTDSGNVVQSISGNLVDNTDPQNPVVNNPTITQVTGLQGELDNKLTAAQGAAVADAVDGADVVAQFNSLLASLRTAGVIAT